MIREVLIDLLEANSFIPYGAVAIDGSNQLAVHIRGNITIFIDEYKLIITRFGNQFNPAYTNKQYIEYCDPEFFDKLSKFL